MAVILTTDSTLNGVHHCHMKLPSRGPDLAARLWSLLPDRRLLDSVIVRKTSTLFAMPEAMAMAPFMRPASGPAAS